MKIKFFRDYRDFKAGDVIEASEPLAEELHEAGAASVFVEETESPKEVEVKTEPKKKIKTK